MIEPGQIRRFHTDLRIYVDLGEYHIIEAEEMIVVDKIWCQRQHTTTRTAIWDILHWGRRLLVAEDLLEDVSDSL